MSETKRIATAYLPYGKELRFVFDNIHNSADGINFILEQENVAYIPYDVPIIFEPFKEEHKIPQSNDTDNRSK